MKLDEFRRKAHKGILPDHKVEKSKKTEVEKTQVAIECVCGGTFGELVNYGTEKIARCPMCAAKVVFYVCANMSCDNSVESRGMLCRKCAEQLAEDYNL